MAADVDECDSRAEIGDSSKILSDPILKTSQWAIAIPLLTF
jgi:hypothetical protein